MPTSWTNLGEAGRYAFLDGARTHFRIEDLIELAAMLRMLSDDRRSM
jgi:hypothetical protein